MMNEQQKREDLLSTINEFIDIANGDVAKGIEEAFYSTGVSIYELHEVFNEAVA